MPNEILTPSLIIDGNILRRNLSRMADYATGHGLSLRPHTKTHKSRYIAGLQVAAGTSGLTVAKASEATIMIDDTDGLLMAYPPVDAQRCVQIAELAAASPQKSVRVAIDSVYAAEQISNAASSVGVTVGVLVEIDVGLKRTGVQTPEASLAIAQCIDGAEGLRLDGLMYYPGQFKTTPKKDDPELRRVNELLGTAIDLWRRAGLEAAIVSGGSTPTAPASHLFEHTTEIRPGTYVFNDINSVNAGVATLDDCAARVCATVISDAVPGQVVIDAGSKALTSERPGPDASHGHIVEYPLAMITSLKEEHGMVDITPCDRPPKIGERVTIIPNHICPCVNLQDRVWLDEEGQPPTPLRVDARGRVT